MRRRLLRYLALFTFRRAWFILPLLAALTGLALWQALQLEFDTSLKSFLPPPTAEDQLIRELLGDYRKLEPVMITLRAREPGHEADLITLGYELARSLDDQAYFSTPIYKAEERPFLHALSLKQLIYLLPPEDWDLLAKRVDQELRQTTAWRLNALTPRSWQQNDLITPSLLKSVRERIATSRGPTRMINREGYYFSIDGRSLLLLAYPVLSPEDGNAALKTLRFTRRCVKFLFERHQELSNKISIEFNGSIISTGQHIERIADELGVILRFAIPLALLLYLIVFRKLESLFFIALPPAIAVTWTLGLAHFLFGGITGVTAMFLLIILAIGIDYTIHLYHRFTIELYRTNHYYRALSRSFVETGRGIFASAALMCLLFLLLLATSLGGERESSHWINIISNARGFPKLGLVAGLGLACNLLACLLSLPLMAAIKYALAKGRVKPVPLYRFHLHRLYLPAILNPRATLAIILLISVVLGLAARQLEFAQNFAAISPFFYRPADAESPQIGSKPEDRSDFLCPGRPIIAFVSGRNMQEALECNDRLEANLRDAMKKFNIFAYDSLRWTLPSLATQQASLKRLFTLNTRALRDSLQKTIVALNLRTRVLEPLFSKLAIAQREARHPEFILFGPQQPEEFILNVQRHVAHRDNRFYLATVIYPYATGFAPPLIPLLRQALENRTNHVVLVGDPIIERELSHLIKINLAALILVSFFFVIAMLCLHFRSVKRGIIVFIPILFAVISLCGAITLAGIKIHFFTVMALPLALCLVIDHALQFAQYYFDCQPCSVKLTMHTLGRVMVLSGGTIALFFGTIGLTSYPGLRDFGATLLFALLITAISIFMLLPALLQIFAREQSIWQTLFPETIEIHSNY